MPKKNQKFKNNIRNASVMGGLLTACLAVTTLFCNNKGESESKNLPNGIGAWTLEATSKNITLTVNSCLKNHAIYCEYDISKFNSSGVQIGLYSSLSGGICKTDKIIDDSNPCDLNQGNMSFEGGQANYYKFNKVTCYDTTKGNQKLVNNTEIPKMVKCK